MIKMSTGVISSDPRSLAYRRSVSSHGLPSVCALVSTWRMDTSLLD